MTRLFTLIFLISAFSGRLLAGSLQTFSRLSESHKLYESIKKESVKAYQSPGSCQGRAIIITLESNTKHRGSPKKCARGETNHARSQTKLVIYSIDPSNNKTGPAFEESVDEVHALIWDSEAVSVCADILIALFDPFYGRGTPDDLIRLRYENGRYRRIK